jgi:FimV-like protein
MIRKQHDPAARDQALPATRAALVSALLAAAFVCASPAQGADLGGLRVLSPSGEPLWAEIVIDTIGSQHEAETLQASLASREVYDRTHLDYKDALSDLKFEIVDRPDGHKVVSITSSKPVDASVLDLLVELSWNQGHFIRQYTFILDAPAASAAAPAEALPSAVQVQPGETLSGIADRVQPDGVTLNQTMAALLHANPNAFVGGDMNRLRAGAKLAVPKRDAIAAENAAQARAMVQQQTAAFDSYRQRLASKAGQVLPHEEGQTASGRIEPMPAEEAPAPSGDALKLSSEGSPAEKEQDQTAEAKDSADKAVQEAASRLKELQGNVDAMRGLLEAQNDTGAQAQQQAEAAPVQVAQAAAADGKTADAKAADVKAAESKGTDTKAVLGAVAAVLAAIAGALILRRRNERKDGLGTDGDAKLVEEAAGGEAADTGAGVAGVAPIAAAAMYADNEAPVKAAESVNNLKDWDEIPPFPIPETLPPADNSIASLADDPYEDDFDEISSLPGSAPAPSAAAFDLDLDIDQPSTAVEAPAAVGAKLDLAKAYVELGDRKGARELLEEIAQAGSPDQQARARTLLAGL